MKGKLNVSVLDAAALTVSLFRRDFKTAGLLVVLLGLGEMLENFTRKRSMASLADELALRVDTVWVRAEDGRMLTKSLKDVTEADRVVVRAGSAIPVDGVVLAGEGEVNQASMTGEALPVRRSQGGSVFAGTVLEAGEIDVRPTGVGDGTRLSQIVDFIEKSEKARPESRGRPNAGPTASCPRTSSWRAWSTPSRATSTVRRRSSWSTSRVRCASRRRSRF